MYTVVPFIMIGVLFYFTARDENNIDKLSTHPDVVVNVTGFQWSWSFQYPQYPVDPGRRCAAAPTCASSARCGTASCRRNRTRCRCWRSPFTRRSGST